MTIWPNYLYLDSKEFSQEEGLINDILITMASDLLLILSLGIYWEEFRTIRANDVSALRH